VPNERLGRYLYAFRFGHFVSKEQKTALVEQVRERLRVAEAADVRDEELIKNLKRLIEIIPTNTSS
jgi:N12 class adenine-specific DNA methylase